MSRSSFILISLVLCVGGLVVVLNSVGWGSETANAYLRSQGGGMDAAQFMVALQEYISSYRWIGSILSLLGGLAVLKAVELK